MAFFYLLLFVSVFIETAKNTFYNFFGKSLLKSTDDSLVFNIVSCAGAVAFFSAVLAITGQSFSVSRYSFLLSIVFAITTVCAQYFGILSMALGPMSFSVLFTYLSAVIPTVFGAVYNHTPPTFIQITGLVLMVITFFLSIDFSENSEMSFKWILAVAGSFIGMGSVGVIQTLHQSSDYSFELCGFLFWTFIFSTLFFFILHLFARGKRKEKIAYKGRDIRLMLITGILIGVVNVMNLYLSGQLPSIIFFPIVNGGAIILSILSSVVLFKEKLPPKKIAGLVCGIVATCLIGIQ